ncbi:MAG TPA: NAD(P)H-hydrate dehydratase [Gemmatimonadaceae bacterium]|nr:NAD(P)H-hydrate dehydratase [Gemmatimonadaceae bacterium]
MSPRASAPRDKTRGGRRGKSESERARRPHAVTARALRAWPLPRADDEGDKEVRGRVLVVGGAVSMPGAPLLAGVAALRAGAGKLQLATCESVAPTVGVALPEALVTGLAETAQGGIAARAAAAVAEHAESTDALLVGPGMVDERAIAGFLARLLPGVTRAIVVLDAGALPPLVDQPALLHHLGGRAVVTPHAGEMASLLGVPKEEVERDPVAAALRAARDLRAVVALKGGETIVAEPDGTLHRYSGGHVGLATSGSGDTLAGVVAGLAARGATPAQAAVWAVFLHGEAGNALAGSVGPVGYLARELLDEIPPIMARLAKR